MYMSVSAFHLASQASNHFIVRQPHGDTSIQFNSSYIIYMEPSHYQYINLKIQRDQGGYEHWLQQSIDNAQDKRNFVREVGRDMLPFRSYEAAALDTSNTVRNKIPDGVPGPVITATPGEPYIVPLRWNKPHAAELEVNVWISNNQYVVPIRKPTCSGEGYQDQVFAFTIPTDFNLLGSKVPGWTGCKKEGDCVLQIYAHSVEPRTYAIGIPLVVTGDVSAPTAIDLLAIQPAQVDVGLDLNKLTHNLCLSSASPEADISTAVPCAARLVSDAFNHAYQNSDYSPYSGQQPSSISRNLQSSIIIAMIPANQGELGGKLFKQTNPVGAALQAKLVIKANKLIKAYESVVNNIIAKVGDKSQALKTNDTMGVNGVQKTVAKFRAAETGSVTSERLRTTTYVPSFQLPVSDVPAARALTPRQYRGLIDAQGQVRLYETVLNDLIGDFQRAADRGLVFQPAMIKTTVSSMQDVTAFRKLNAQGKPDGGIYAAIRALQTKAAARAAFNMKTTYTIADIPLDVDASLSNLSYNDTLPDTGASPVDDIIDHNDIYYDALCQNDTNMIPCNQINTQTKPMFNQNDDGNLIMANEIPTHDSSHSDSSSSSSSGVLSSSSSSDVSSSGSSSSSSHLIISSTGSSSTGSINDAVSLIPTSASIIGIYILCCISHVISNLDL